MRPRRPPPERGGRGTRGEGTPLSHGTAKGRDGTGRPTHEGVHRAWGSFTPPRLASRIRRLCAVSRDAGPTGAQDRLPGRRSPTHERPARLQASRVNPRRRTPGSRPPPPRTRGGSRDPRARRAAGPGGASKPPPAGRTSPERAVGARPGDAPAPEGRRHRGGVAAPPSRVRVHRVRHGVRDTLSRHAVRSRGQDLEGTPGGPLTSSCVGPRRQRSPCLAFPRTRVAVPIGPSPPRLDPSPRNPRSSDPEGPKEGGAWGPERGSAGSSLGPTGGAFPREEGEARPQGPGPDRPRMGARVPRAEHVFASRRRDPRRRPRGAPPPTRRPTRREGWARGRGSGQGGPTGSPRPPKGTRGPSPGPPPPELTGSRTPTPHGPRGPREALGPGHRGTRGEDRVLPPPRGHGKGNARGHSERAPFLRDPSRVLRARPRRDGPGGDPVRHPSADAPAKDTAGRGRLGAANRPATPPCGRPRVFRPSSGDGGPSRPPSPPALPGAGAEAPDTPQSCPSPRLPSGRTGPCRGAPPPPSRRARQRPAGGGTGGPTRPRRGGWDAAASRYWASRAKAPVAPGRPWVHRPCGGATAVGTRTGARVARVPPTPSRRRGASASPGPPPPLGSGGRGGPGEAGRDSRVGSPRRGPSRRGPPFPRPIPSPRWAGTVGRGGGETGAPTAPPPRRADGSGFRRDGLTAGGPGAFGPLGILDGTGRQAWRPAPCAFDTAKGPASMGGRGGEDGSCPTAWPRPPPAGRGLGEGGGLTSPPRLLLGPPALRRRGLGARRPARGSGDRA